MGYSKVSQGLSGSSISLAYPYDIFYWLDIIVIILLLLFHIIKMNKHSLKLLASLTVFSVGCLCFTINIYLSDIDHPQILTKTFDRSYIVKSLGIDVFTLYDGVKSQHTNELRQSAKKSELKSILAFNKQHYASPSHKTWDIAQGKNVIVIHLESFQEFLINLKVNGQEVTPFLNHIYNSNNTYSFDNFFNQIGQGKTSDAENLLETSTYGLPQGSLFAQLGNDNTFQAAPAILGQHGYTSAVFHGNVGSFWNRSNTYKNLGYNYFFDASYYDTSGDKSTGYGLKDKLLFKDSIKYLQHLQQPFYVKYITVTNHFPFNLDDEDRTPFSSPTTDNQTVNNYFTTAHYLDDSVREFYKYLKKSGLDKNTLVVIYGDHYGISNAENKSLAPILGKNPKNWDDFDNIQVQRVPLMFNSPSIHNGKVLNTYGGEIDVLPTLLHMLGINSQEFIQFGTDLFSPNHDQTVAFRNHDWTNPKYTAIDGTIYNNKTQQPMKLDKQQQIKFEKIQARVNLELALSDSLNERNLLKFYHPKDFTSVNPKKYNYANGYHKELKIEKSKRNQSTSLFSKNHKKSTTHLYITDAPEDNHSSTDSNRIKITNPDENKVEK